LATPFFFGDTFVLGDAFFLATPSLLATPFFFGDTFVLGDAFFTGDTYRRFKRGKDKD